MRYLGEITLFQWDLKAKWTANWQEKGLQRNRLMKARYTEGRDRPDGLAPIIIVLLTPFF